MGAKMRAPLHHDLQALLREGLGRLQSPPSVTGLVSGLMQRTNQMGLRSSSLMPPIRRQVQLMIGYQYWTGRVTQTSLENPTQTMGKKWHAFRWHSATVE